MLGWLTLLAVVVFLLEVRIRRRQKRRHFAFNVGPARTKKGV